MGLGYSTFTNLTSNNNDFYTTTGAKFAIGGTGSIAAPTVAVTLANFQAATAKDGASVYVQPVFTSTTDLRLIVASNVALNNLGTPVSVTDDIDCVTRSITPIWVLMNLPLLAVPLQVWELLQGRHWYLCRNISNA